MLTRASTRSLLFAHLDDRLIGWRRDRVAQAFGMLDVDATEAIYVHHVGDRVEGKLNWPAEQQAVDQLRRAFEVVGMAA
jgi:hypothetical protein